MFAFKCYLSAYLSAARTTTLALQQFKELPGFDAWYAPHQERLRLDPVAKFLLDARNAHLHGGPSPVSGGSFRGDEALYYFSPRETADGQVRPDVVSTCRQHFVTLLGIVRDCYVRLGVYIDPQQHYTKEHFAGSGRTIEDAEVEVRGWVMESLAEDGYNEDDRWHELRSHVGECQINHLFYSYLGRVTPQPLEPEYYADFKYSPEDKGWIHVPAGYASLEDYQRQFGIMPEEP